MARGDNAPATLTRTLGQANLTMTERSLATCWIRSGEAPC